MDRLYYPSGELYCASTDTHKEYYYENGAPKTIERYQDGVLEGEVRLYWPNRQLKRTCIFSKGARHGWDRIWNDQGVLVDEGEYESGRPKGLHRRWNRQGALIEEIRYLSESRFNVRSWNDEGELCVETCWVDASDYQERVWDRFEKVWVEKQGYWDGSKLVYL